MLINLWRLYLKVFSGQRLVLARRRGKRLPRRFAPWTEPLEVRVLLSAVANVEARITLGSLYLTGNTVGTRSLTVTQDTLNPSLFDVTPGPGTTINGSTATFQFPASQLRDNIFVNLNNGTGGVGSTEFGFSATSFTLGGSIFVTLAGDGPDRVSLEGVQTTGSLFVTTGSGNDRVLVDNAQVRGVTSINTGNGSDTIDLRRSTFNLSTTVDGGLTGGDTLNVDDVTFNGPFTVNMWKAGNTINVEQNSQFPGQTTFNSLANFNYWGVVSPGGGGMINLGRQGPNTRVQFNSLTTFLAWTVNTSVSSVSFGRFNPNFIFCNRTPVSITTLSLPEGKQNQPGYSATIETMGGNGPLTFSVSQGTLPTGLTLNPITGVISGTPTVAGTSNFTVKVLDSNGTFATQPYSLVINPAISLPPSPLPTWSAGVAYTPPNSGNVITATGGIGVTTLTVTNLVNPVPGLSVLGSGSSTVTVSGIPGAAGVVTFRVTAVDSLSNTVVQDYSLTINAAVAITTETLANWTQNRPGYSQTIATTGGTGAVTFSVTAGTLPAGLLLNSSTGVISGTPTSTGASTFTIQAIDSVGSLDTQEYTVTINETVAITTTTLLNWTQDRPGYSQTVDTVGGTAPIGFSVTSGALPAGLSLNASTGLISGTPTALGSSNFTIQALDAAGASDSQAYTVVINPVVSITTTSLADWTQNQAGYSQTIATTGGTAPIGFSVTAGTLPDGLALNPTTGALTGTPTTVGLSTFTIEALDNAGSADTHQYSITINAGPTLPAALTNPEWTQGLLYTTETIQASNGTAPVTLVVSAVTPLAGMTIDGSGTDTITLSGTPTATGTLSFTVTATDAAGAEAVQSYSLLVNPALVLPAALTNTQWTEGVLYPSEDITALHGTGANTLTVSAVTPLAGMTINGNGTDTVTVSGTPTTTGTLSFTVTATDSVGATTVQTYSLLVNASPVLPADLTNPEWTEGLLYPDELITATEGTGTKILTVSAVTPLAGMTISGSGTDAVTLSGTPTAPGTLAFTVTAADQVGAITVQSYTLVVNAALTLPAELANPEWTENVDYPTETIQASNGTGANTLTLTDITLVAGLSVSGDGTDTITVSGTPTTTGTLAFTVTATDSVGATTVQSYSLVVNATPVLPTELTNPAWTQGLLYPPETIQAANGTGTVILTVSAVTPVAGLTIDGSGTDTVTLSGTPTGVGTLVFTVTATDSVGAIAVQTYSLTVNPALTLPPALIDPEWTQGENYPEFQIVASNGTGANTLALSNASLPSGMSLSGDGTDTITLSGTPTETGTYSFTVTATDSVGATAVETYSLIINAGITLPDLIESEWTVDQLYPTQLISASGGTAPIDLQVTVDTALTGLTAAATDVNEVTLSGTPTITGDFVFTVTATDAAGAVTQRQYTVTVNAAATLPDLVEPAWTVDQLYPAQFISATGGTAPLGLAVTIDTALAGMSAVLTGANEVTLSGTPTTTGDFVFTVTATDHAGVETQRQYTVTVNPLATLPDLLEPAWTVGELYPAQVISAADGTAPIDLQVTIDSALAGLSAIVTGTNEVTVSGTPSTTGDFVFTVTAIDHAGAQTQKQYTVTVNAAATLPDLFEPAWTVNQAYPTQLISATGGTAPLGLAVTIDTALAGLSATLTDTNEVTLSGTPTETGDFVFTVTATDHAGAVTQRQYTVTINAGPVLPALAEPAWTVNQLYPPQLIAATGGTAPIDLQVAIDTPLAGMSAIVTGTNEVTLSGTPTETGDFVFTVTATDHDGATAQRQYTVTINAAATLPDLVEPAWTINQLYPTQLISATGGTAPLGLAVTIDTALAGLSATLTDTNEVTLSGTPTATGDFVFTVTATDHAGVQTQQQYTVTVNAAATLPDLAEPAWTVGQPYPLQLISASGGTAPLQLAVTVDTALAGLTAELAGLNEVTLSGTPTAIGDFVFTVTATDHAGVQTQKQYTVTVNAAATLPDLVEPAWTINQLYPEQLIFATGGTAPLGLAVTIDTSLAGMSAQLTGVNEVTLSGTPIATGDFVFTVTATDHAGVETQQQYTVTMNAAVTITTASLPDWTEGVLYSQLISATGGTGTINFALAALSVLPAGLTLDSDGLVHGTPTTPGTTTFDVVATDSTGSTDSQTHTVTIHGPVHIDTLTLPNWTEGVDYDATIIAGGGTGDLEYTLASGSSLPAGLVLDFFSGTITGAPTAAGTTTFTVVVTDQVGGTASQEYTVTINDPVVIETLSVPDGAVNSPYLQTIVAKSGTGTLTYDLGGTLLPAGLTLDPNTGVISGTPTTQEFAPFTIIVTDAVGGTASQDYSITINPPIVIDPATLPEGTEGIFYSEFTTASGGSGTFTYSLAALSVLPEGLTLDNATGEIFGTPLTAATTTFSIVATDSNGSAASHEYTLTINPPVTITTLTLPDWTEGHAYSQLIATDGGTAPLFFSLVTGAFPDGLDIDGATGLISGTPTTPGEFTYEVEVDDAVGSFATQSYTVQINAALVLPAELNNPQWTIGQSYPLELIQATNGTGANTLTVSSVTPLAGMSIDGSGTDTVTLSGTPTATGTLSFTVTATDSVGATTQQTYSLLVNPAPVLPATLTNPEWTEGLLYTDEFLSAIDGTDPVLLTVSLENLPAGMTLIGDGTATLTLGGTPTATGDFGFTVTATDFAGASTVQAYTLHINAALALPTALDNPAWTINQLYPDQSITAANGTGVNTLAVTFENLPAGMTLAGDGTSTLTLGGTPSETGDFGFTVTATDAVGATTVQAYTLHINASLTLPDLAEPAWTINEIYPPQLIAATGGTAPTTLGITIDTALAGMSAIVTDTNEVTLSGTPTATGDFLFTVTATDAAGAVTSRQYVVTVNAAATLPDLVTTQWTVDQTYPKQLISASGGTGPLDLSVVVDTALAGLNATVTGPNELWITGMPTESGDFVFTATVVDHAGATTLRQYTITVNPAVALPADLVTNVWTQNEVYPTEILTAVPGTGTGPIDLAVTIDTALDGMSASATGVNQVTISGTPTVEGDFTFTVTATDVAGSTTSQSYTVHVNASVFITTISLENWTIDQPNYSQLIGTSGGTAPLTFAVLNGTLPDGLDLDSATGVITGTPTTTGTSVFQISVIDQAGSIDIRPYEITINDPIAITTTSLPDWTQGQAYNESVATTGGTAPFNFVTSGDPLPDGLSLDPVSGVISGTPTTPGTSSFVVTVTDIAGSSDSQAYSITIHAALAITTLSLPDWTQNLAYSQTITTSGGTDPKAFEITAGTLPEGLLLNPGTGAITGTPVAAGTNNFTVTVTDAAGAVATQAYSITINASLQFVTSVLADETQPLRTWTKDLAGYSDTVSTVNGTGTVTFALAPLSVLPDGLILDSDGLIHGDPTTAGTITFTVIATDTVGATASHAFSITINPAVEINTLTLPNWTVNQPGYAQTINAQGGTGQLTYAFTAGTFPVGLALDPANGNITGTPTVEASYDFTITVTDSIGATASHDYTVTVNGPLAIDTPTLPAWTHDASGYSQFISVSGGTSLYTYQVTSGGLPQGLSLDPLTGEIAGTPTATGTANFTVTVTDASGATVSQSYSVVINPPVSFTTTTLASWTAGRPGYSQNIVATGGTGAKSYALAVGSTLPDGLILDSDGLIHGTPSTAGSTSFTVVATDDVGGNASQLLAIVINAPVTITTVALDNGQQDHPGYSQPIVTSGGTTPFTFAVADGSSLPGGLLLDASTGVISGTPTLQGAYTFTIDVVDAAGSTDSQAIDLTIEPPGSITTLSLHDWTVNTPGYSETIETNGLTAPVTFAVAASPGPLPDGLTLDTDTGVISGTPTALGSFTFAIEATDDDSSVTVSQQYTVVIRAAVAITTNTLTGWTQNSSGYSQTIATSGGAAPLTFAVSAGSRPAGLALNPSTGVISGTATTLETQTFTIRVTDFSGTVDSQEYTVTVNPPLVITTTTLAEWTQGQAAYSQFIATTGGTGSKHFSVSAGDLPSGLSLNSGTGEILGTPDAAGTSAFTIQATDDTGAVDSQAFSLTINAPVSIATTTLPEWTEGLAGYNQSITAVNGTVPYTFSVSAGALPSGLTLAADTGVISGTPDTAGSSTFTIEVVDAAGSTATQEYTLVINSAITFVTTTLPDWTQDQPRYSQTISALGGTGVLTYTRTAGSLPAGLTLNSATGLLSGTPTTPGLYNFTIEAADGIGGTASQPYSVTINDPLDITTTTLADWTHDQPGYSQTISTTGGTGPLTFSVSAGALPAGLSLNSATGLISGTTTAPATTTFTIRVQDVTGAFTTQEFTVTVNPSVSITTASLPDWTQNAAGYSQTVVATGGTGALAFSVVAGALPEGLDLNGSTGVISGTPTVIGTANFTIQALDETGAAATRAFSIEINAPLVITTLSLPDSTQNENHYDVVISTTGGTAPVSFAVTAGSLPAGLSLSELGVITGTPTTPGVSTFTVEVVDQGGGSATHEFTLTINPPILIITTSLPDYQQNHPGYSQAIATSGGTAPLTFSILSGSLPTGLTLDASTGVISGTPTVMGTSTFTIEVLDAALSVDAREYSITITDPGAITTIVLPNWTIGIAYDQLINTNGLTPPVSFEVVAGALPDGLALSSASDTAARISGTPTATGTFNFTIRAHDDDFSVHADQAYTIVISSAISIVTSTLPNWTEGHSGYSQTIVTSAGTAPVTFSLDSGNLPTGLTLNSSTGVLSGTPTAQGSYDFTLRATDVAGSTATQSYNVVISAPLAITTASLPNWTHDQPYSQNIITSGGTGTQTFSISAGALPAGLSLNSSSGAITGTPTSAATFTFTVQVVDSTGATATHDYTVVINADVSITTTTLASWTKDVSGYSQTIATADGTAPMTFSVRSGDSLPAGLNLTTSTGEISGTPTATGSTTFTIDVVDAAGSTASKQFTITINAALSITSTSPLATWTVDQAGYSQTVTTAGGTGPMTFSLKSGSSLPAGLTLNSATGVISGTPTATGTTNFTIVVVDSTGATAEKALAITINSALSITTNSLPNGRNGRSYSTTLAASGGTGARTWSVSIGSLPTGLSLNPSTGVISGTPTVTGTRTFTIKVVDATGAFTTKQFTIRIESNN